MLNGLLLVFASKKVVHDVRVKMAEFVVSLRKEIKDSLTRQGMQNIRGLHRKRLAKRGKEERILLSEKAHKQVLTVKKSMHLILHSAVHSSTRAQEHLPLAAQEYLSHWPFTRALAHKSTSSQEHLSP